VPTVLFKLNDSVTAEERASFVPTVEKGLSSIPFGTRAAAGPPMFDVRTSGYEYSPSSASNPSQRPKLMESVGLYREFKDLDEFNAYRVHPDHMG
jgi:hypothetical protein